MGSGGPRGLQILRSGVSVRGGFDSHAFPPFVALALAAALLIAGSAQAQKKADPDSLPRPHATVRADTVAAPAVPPAPTFVRPPPIARPSTVVIPAGPAADTLPPNAAATRDSIARTPGAARIDTATASPARRLGRAPRVRKTEPEMSGFDQPRWVMLRSLLVPGWGQFHNQAWIKGALVAVGDGTLRFQALRDERRLSTLNRDATSGLNDLNAAIADTAAAGAAYRAALAGGDPQEIAQAEAALQAAQTRVRSAGDHYNQAASVYNALLDAATNRRWLMGGVLLYALLDAYVDAHFRTFDVDFKVDPALPAGPGKSAVPNMRMTVRWSF